MADPTQPEDYAPQPAGASAPGEASASSRLGRFRAIGPDGAFRDGELDRAVEGRVADAAHADDLLREARFLARLEHANIPCVHDFVRGDGGALLIQRRVEGVSLAEAATKAAAGAPVPEIATPTACAITIMKVCDAVSAAHARGVVHRSLRPECVLLGWHGQVLVGDWRTAMGKSERPETLRFVTSAKPTAAVALDDLHQDIRGIGVCLFTALALRAPAAAGSDPVGEIGSAFSGRVPLALEAIVRRAMASDAATGYRSADELSTDLARYVEGQLPSIYRPGAITRTLRWLELHRRQLAAATLVLLVAIALTAVFAGRQLWAYATWGQPVVSETFSDDGWKQRWKEGAAGSLAVRDSRLISIGERGAVLMCTQRFTTPVAIEYTGIIQPGARPGDLSVWWTEHNDALKDPVAVSSASRSFAIQAGAWENSFCAIYANPGYERVAHANRQLEPGKAYRFRVQIDGARFRQWIDGDLVLDYTDTFPTVSGYLSLYGYYPGKVFDDVKIWQQEVTSYVSPLAIGDSAYQFGRYADAAEDYARVAQSHVGRTLGEEALFRQGLTERRLGQRGPSDATWKRLADSTLSHRAEVIQMSDLAADGEWNRLVALFRQYWQERPDVRADLRDRWQRLGWQYRADAAVGERLLSLREALFPADELSASVAAEILLGRGRYQEVLTKFSGERRVAAQALLALGRTDEVLSADWTILDEKSLVRLIRADFSSIAADPVEAPDRRVLALCKLGRGEEALALTGTSPTRVLYHLGRAAEILAVPDATPAQCNEALLVLGRYDEAAAAGDGRALLLLGRLDEAELDFKKPQPYHRMLAALTVGQDDLARSWRSQVRANADMRERTKWFLGTVALPLLDQRFGQAGSLAKALQAAKDEPRKLYGGRAALVAQAALDPEGKAPWAASDLRSDLAAMQAIATALRGELAGDRAAALAGWLAFRALPAQQRLLDEYIIDLEIEAFARWRAWDLAR